MHFLSLPNCGSSPDSVASITRSRSLSESESVAPRAGAAATSACKREGPAERQV